MGSDRMIEFVTELCNCLQPSDQGSDLPALDIQIGYWAFIQDLRPSLLIAGSTSLCDLEYMYVVTHREKVHRDVLSKVAAVMAPIVQRIYRGNEEIPTRREIPEDVRRSLRGINNAQVSRYLDAHIPLVVMPTAWEQAAPMRARRRRQEKEQARLDAIKLGEQRERMRERMRYMEEDIPRDLAYRPAEIYSPNRRRRKILEGKARISRPPKGPTSVTGTEGHDEESEVSDEPAAEPSSVRQRVTRKRSREMVDELHDPSRVKKKRVAKGHPAVVGTERRATSAKSDESEIIRRRLKKAAIQDLALLSPSTPTNQGSRNKKLSFSEAGDSG
ncbi:hypothetical protein HOY80DRAFT_1020531, partial [Tuber brumale]